MTEWTPGPWKADIRAGSIAVYPASEDHNCLDGMSSEVIHWKTGYKEMEGDEFIRWVVRDEDAANAKLIARAPEMAALLQRWATWAAVTNDSWDGVIANLVDTRALLRELEEKP